MMGEHYSKSVGSPIVRDLADSELIIADDE
jgi:hypothetical protein